MTYACNCTRHPHPLTIMTSNLTFYSGRDKIAVGPLECGQQEAIELHGHHYLVFRIPTSGEVEVTSVGDDARKFLNVETHEIREEPFPPVCFRCGMIGALEGDGHKCYGCGLPTKGTLWLGT